MPAPPRRPTFTAPSGRGFRNPAAIGGRLRLSGLRDEASIELDRGPGRVPFVRWPDFYADFSADFRQGDHVVLMGDTGSGKTVMAVQAVLPQRQFVVVLATKRRDRELYPKLEAAGYRTISRWENPDPERNEEDRKLIFRPPLEAPTDAAKAAQRAAFQTALVDIFNTGGWCVFCDEIRYLTDNLGLRTEVETLYLQGRSLDISMVAGTQRPVSIPLVAIDQARHVFIWQFGDLEDVKRAAQFTGRNYETARRLIPLLPEHEALYVAKKSGRMVRTKVDLREHP